MNVLIATGIVADEVRAGEGKSGVKYASINLRVETEVEGKARTNCFIRCTCFGKLAGFVGDKVKRGSLVNVAGRLQSDSYEKDGKTVRQLICIAEQIELLGESGKTLKEFPEVLASAESATKKDSQPEPQEKETADDTTF